MAELTITSSACLATGSFQKTLGQAGETITAGMVVYKKSSDGKMYKAQNDGTLEESCSGVDNGVSLTDSVLAGQYFVYLTGGTITIGATVVAGTAYYLGATAGSISLFSDIGTGGTKYVTIIGFATTTAIINVAINPTGTFKA
ncbi:MAG TPA: hypothetical protein VNT76_19695 [Candidatus Binatus sp.]|nr:hypothetical protein [Candidatus Binatus sp.]